MKFEKINGWLTFVANVGVIIGLIFLVMELDQSNKQAAAATDQDRSNVIDQHYREFAHSDYLPGIYAKIEQSGVESLTKEEFLRAQNWESSRVIRMTGQVFQYEQGYLDEDNYLNMLGVARTMLPLWLELGLYKSVLGGASIEFIALVEATTQEPE